MSSKLEEIGFYTLSDERAKNMCASSPMWRGEIIITDRCNFKCQYCRGLGPDICGDLSVNEAESIMRIWCSEGLKNIRFSGGEPILHPELPEMITYAREHGVQRIAISTNGSGDFAYYQYLRDLGVRDFSISLDACCAADTDKMSGTTGYFQEIIDNIRELSKISYVTVGVVINKSNLKEFANIVNFAATLGVADIRVITAAQNDDLILNSYDINIAVLMMHPILNYRMKNIAHGESIRGLKETDTRCYLVQDDSAVAGNWHFPCIIYLRENGEPIGRIHDGMRSERVQWSINHNVFEDEICRKNCLDVCVATNRRVQEFINGNL